MLIEVSKKRYNLIKNMCQIEINAKTPHTMQSKVIGYITVTCNHRHAIAG